MNKMSTEVQVCVGDIAYCLSEGRTKEGLDRVLTDIAATLLRKYERDFLAQDKEILRLQGELAAGNFHSDCQDQSYNALHDAAKELVLKIKAIHANEEYKSVWALAAIHGNPYVGPKYDQEIKALAEQVGLVDSGL